MYLPIDFGKPGYAQRRSSAIEKHFSMLPAEVKDLLFYFDYSVDCSEDLRHYLSAHHPQDVEIARKILGVLPGNVVHKILRYLINDYWGRYLGWPDLLVHKPSEFKFVEVKSSKDKLKDDQKNWIRDNTNLLHLPFEMVKIHRQNL